MYARGKVAVDEAWRGRLIDFFQYLCQAVTKVDRCALVASLLASDLDKSDDTGKAISAQIGEIFNRQKEEGVQPVQTELSWFLDENEFGSDPAPDGGPPPLPKAWRLGDRPNLKQMHDDACANRVTAEAVELKLLAEVRATKGLTQGTRAFGARVHMLPERPRDVEFHFAVLPPAAVSNAGRPSRAARRFIDETTGSDRPRIRRNAVVLVAPSTDGLDVARLRVREYLGWDDVQQQLKGQPQDPVRENMLATWTEEARRRMPEAIRQAWTIVVTANPRNEIQAFRVTVGSDPLFATVKADRRARIQETAINAEALLPGGPYDLWRDDEPSRRVKDLASAFAEHPRLPKMLRVQEIRASWPRASCPGSGTASRSPSPRSSTISRAGGR